VVGEINPQAAYADIVTQWTARGTKPDWSHKQDESS
jgi:hypothetical protein